MLQDKICKFHFLQGALSNVGKSFLAGLLVEYFTSKSIDYRLVDGDIADPDVDARYSVWGKSISGIALDGNISSFDRIINLTQSIDCCIINLPVGNSKIFDSWLEENCYPDFIYYHWFLHDGSKKSTNHLRKLLINHPSDRFILVHNLLFGEEIPPDLKSLFLTNHHFIELPYIQFSDSDLLLIEQQPKIPYSKLPFSRSGKIRYRVAVDGVFEQIDCILKKE